MHRHVVVGFTFTWFVLLTFIYFATVDRPRHYRVVYRRTRDSLRVPGSCVHHSQCANLEVCLHRRCESLWTEPFATGIDPCFDACASSLSRRMKSDNILVRAKKLHGYCAVEVEVVNGSAYDGEEKDTLIKLSRRFTETTVAALCRAPPVKLQQKPMSNIQTTNKCKRICPCCGGCIDELGPFGIIQRKAQCKKCGVVERQRMVCAIMKHKIKPYGRWLYFGPHKNHIKSLRDAYPEVVFDGIDYFAKGYEQHYSTDTLKGDVQNLRDIESGSYDGIIILHVLEHVDDVIKSIDEIYRVLKINGVVVQETPCQLEEPSYRCSAKTQQFIEPGSICQQKDHVWAHNCVDLKNQFSTRFDCEWVRFDENLNDKYALTYKIQKMNVKPLLCRKKNTNIRSVCKIDADCETHEVCHASRCVQFWQEPMAPAPCHRTCGDHAKKYYDYFYSRHVEFVSAAHTSVDGHCAIDITATGGLPPPKTLAQHKKDYAEFTGNIRAIHGQHLLCKKIARIAIVTAFAKSSQNEFFDYSDYEYITPFTVSNFQIYAEHHGYDLFFLNRDHFIANRKSSWVQIEVMSYYLKKYDWVFWTDVDFFFTNILQPLPLMLDKDMIVSKECIPGNSWKLMSGTLILKNSEWTNNFLDKWNSSYSEYQHKINHDQAAFEDILKNRNKEENIAVMSPNKFMTYDFKNCQGDAEFGVHFPGPNKKKRIDTYMERHKISCDPLLVVIDNTFYQVPNQFGNGHKFVFTVSRDNNNTGYGVLCANKQNHEIFHNRVDVVLVDCKSFNKPILNNEFYSKLISRHAFTVGIPSIQEDRVVIMECIESVLTQTIKPRELVVFMSNVNDKDGKEIKDAIMQLVSGHGIILIFEHTSEQKAAGEARNIIANMASSAWIAFIDSDDIMHRQRLETMGHVLLVQPSLEIILHGYSIENLDNSVDMTNIPTISGEVLRKKRLGKNWNDGRRITNRAIFTAHNGHITIKRSLFLAHYQDEKMQRGQDQEFILRVFRGIDDENTCYVDLPLSIWYERAKHRKRLSTKESTKELFIGGGMSQSEQELLSKIYNNVTSVFEWGMGSSTIIAQRIGIQRLTAVDSAEEWVLKCRRKVNSEYKLIHSNVGDVKEWGFPKDESRKHLWPSYSLEVDKEKTSFDVYLVDGRFRMACAIRALLHGRNSSLVLIHDFQRHYYQQILNVAYKIDQVGKLVVLRRKMEVSRDELIYSWNNYKYVSL